MLSIYLFRKLTRRSVYFGIAAFGTCLSTIIATSICAAGDVVYFRHDHGVAPAGVTLPSKFDEQTERVWRTPTDPGISTPCVCGDLIVFTTWKADEKELATVALDRKTGTQVWRTVAPVREIEAFHPVGSPASSSPAFNGKHIFVFFGSYGLLCYDLEGNLVWEQPLGPFQDEFGASSSPILVDGKVILNEDHDINSFIAAYDQMTGELCWKTDRPAATRSYSSPFLITAGNDPQIVVAGSLKLTAYESASGQPLWWYDGLSRIVDSTPVVADGNIYLATWTPGGDSDDRIKMEPFSDALMSYDKDGDKEIAHSELPADGEIIQRFFRIDLNQNNKLSEDEWAKHARVFDLAQNVAVALKPGTSGQLSSSNVKWTYRRGLPTVPSSVLYNGALYMVKDSGIITSLNADTGELLKQGRAEGRGNYYASLVAGDGKIYAISESGVVTIIKADQTWETLGSFDFAERILATPVFTDNLMIIRTDAAVYAYAGAATTASTTASSQE